MSNTTLLLTCVLLVSAFLTATKAADLPFYAWAQTPPMGWISYDCFGTSVTEQEVLANALYLKEHLLVHGWKYVVIDARWYDDISSFDDRNLNKERTSVRLPTDSYGRLLPSVNRFPSAGSGRDFKPIADKIHAMGLKFGFHTMRGIPRQAVKTKTPIECSTFTAADAGNPQDHCSWCPDMFGVRANEAGQDWYDSLFRLCAAWELDFIKVDDLSLPYHALEIEMIRKAIDKCGRPIVLSISPGPTPVDQTAHTSTHASMWRISGDFWDRWKDLDHAFDLLAAWQGTGGPGHWPDADMIPFGHIGTKCTIAGPDRQSRFTKGEQTMLMSLWALAPSPLMLGANLPDLDEGTLSLFTNDEVIAVNQDSLGCPAKRVAQNGKTEVWIKALQDGSKAIGFFNRSDAEAAIELPWKTAELSGQRTFRNLWEHRELGVFDAKFSD